MATGAGKTRTVIALSDLLMRANWAKRVLFLADRVALVNQAVNAFKRSSAVGFAREPRHREGRDRARLCLDLSDDDGADRRSRRRQAPLRRRATSTSIVIDEAHRSVYRKYGAIFDYFDSLAGRPDRDPEGRGRPRHLSPVRPAARRADRRLRARRGGQGRVPRSAESGFRAAEVPARRHPLRRSVRRGERGVGRGRVGRRRQCSRPGRVRRRQQVAVQRGHRRQGARAPDDRGPEGRGRRPARQDDHLRQEPRSRGIHRRALRRATIRISRDRSRA